MWFFSKKINIFGTRRNGRGDIMLKLTKEEKEEIQKGFNELRSKGEFLVKKELSDEFRKGIMAQGLFFNAKNMIMKSRFNSDRDNKKEFIDKAISSILKAYSFSSLPIYIYDLACFLEMNNNNKEAKRFFKYFLKLQKNFKPNQIQKVLLASRNIDKAVEDAQEKIK